MKPTILEALESTATQSLPRGKYAQTSNKATPSSNDVLLHRDVLLRFLKEASNMGESDMTIDELIETLEDWP